MALIYIDIHIFKKLINHSFIIKMQSKCWGKGNYSVQTLSKTNRYLCNGISLLDPALPSVASSPVESASGSTWLRLRMTQQAMMQKITNNTSAAPMPAITQRHLKIAFIFRRSKDIFWILIEAIIGIEGKLTKNWSEWFGIWRQILVKLTWSA